MSEFSFAVFGDIQMHNEVTARVVERVCAERPDLCIVLGDLVNDADGEDSWEECRRTLAPLMQTCEVVAIPGNHDYDGTGSAEDFCRLFREPGGETFLSLVRAGCRFILLDTQLDFDPSLRGTEGNFAADSPQARWLRAELQQAAACREPSFVFAHHPIFVPAELYDSVSPTIRVDDRSEELSPGNLLPLLIEGDAQIFFAGHLHMYERNLYDGVHFITTGATGFPFPELRGGGNRFSQVRLKRNHFCQVDVRSDGLSCRVIDEYGEPMDGWDEVFRREGSTARRRP